MILLKIFGIVSFALEEYYLKSFFMLTMTMFIFLLSMVKNGFVVLTIKFKTNSRKC